MTNRGVKGRNRCCMEPPSGACRPRRLASAQSDGSKHEREQPVKHAGDQGLLPPTLRILYDNGVTSSLIAAFNRGVRSYVIDSKEKCHRSVMSRHENFRAQDREITETDMTMHKGAGHHRSAAEHHEKAAHHHREAAKHHDEGDHHRAAHHAHAAHGHATHAAHHGGEASKHHAAEHGDPDEDC